MRNKQQPRKPGKWRQYIPPKRSLTSVLNYTACQLRKWHLCSQRRENLRSNNIIAGSWALGCIYGPPLWSGGQSSWLQIQKSGFEFPALPDFLRSSGSGTVSTHSSVQLRSCLEEKVASPVYKTEITAIGIRHSDHVAPSIRESWH
jgi:hypothetical protein